MKRSTRQERPTRQRRSTRQERLTRHTARARGLAALLAAATLAGVALGLAQSAAARDETKAELASAFALRVPLATARNDGLHAFDLTEAVLRAAQTADLRDMRVFNAEGDALPLAPLPLPPPTVAEPQAAPWLRLVPLPAAPQARERLLNDFALRVEKEGGRAVIELSPAEPRPAPSARLAVGGYLIDLRPAHEQYREPVTPGVLTLRFAPDAADFAGRVQLQASDDLVDWRPLATAPLVRNSEFGDRIERGAVEIPRVPPFVRVTVAGDVMPRLDGARFAPRPAPVSAPAPRTRLEVTRGEPAQGAVESLYVDVPVSLPLTRLWLRTQPNQVVRVSVRYRRDAPAERRVRLGHAPHRVDSGWIPEGGTRTLFRLERAGEWIENEPFRPFMRTTQLRIDVLDAPLRQPLIVEAEWEPRRYAFAASGSAPFTLAVGQADARAGPVFNVAPMLAADDPSGSRLPLAQLALTAAVTGIEPGGAAGPAARRMQDAGTARTVLWIVLAVAVVLLGAMAWRIGAQLRRAPPSPAPSPEPAARPPGEGTRR
jgi:hypothetical protein